MDGLEVFNLNQGRAFRLSQFEEEEEENEDESSSGSGVKTPEPNQEENLSQLTTVSHVTNNSDRSRAPRQSEHTDSSVLSLGMTILGRSF